MMIVAKTGGRVIEHGVPVNLVKDIAQITSSNSLVFVHGGGVEVTEIAKKMGKPQQFVVSPKGFRSRYTDKDTVEIYTMVMVGKLNSEIVLHYLAKVSNTLVLYETKQDITQSNDLNSRKEVIQSLQNIFSQVDASLKLVKGKIREIFLSYSS